MKNIKVGKIVLDCFGNRVKIMKIENGIAYWKMGALKGKDKTENFKPVK